MLGQIIIFFIARVSIPAGIGFGVHEGTKSKLGKWAPGAAAHSAYVAHILSGLLITLIRGGHMHMGTLDIILLLAAIGGLVFIFVQPSLPAAGLIIGVQAVVLVMHLIDLPKLFQYFNFWSFVFTAAALAFSILPIVFLVKPLKEEL